MFFFSHELHRRTEYARFTETLSQPITQSVTANRSSPQPPLRMERGVITEIPLRFLRMLSSLSPIISRPIGVTSHTTPLSIRRGAGGEASVFSVCRSPSVGSKRAQKGSVKSVRSVREKNPPHTSPIFFFSQRVSLSLTEGVFFLSQSAQSSRSFLAHVSSPQNASGIQSSQRPHPQPLSEWRGE